MRSVVGLAFASFLLAGCAAPGGPGSGPPGTPDQPPPSPRQLVTLALDRVGQDMGPKGALSALHANITSEQQRGSFDLQFGADGTDLVRIDLPPLNVTLWCRDGEGAVAFGNRTFLAGGSCQDERGQVRDNLTGEQHRVLGVRPEGRGWVADVREVNETGAEHDAAVHLDAEGRVVRVEQEQQGARMDVTLVYGPRGDVALPEVKVPARLNFTTDFDEGLLWWNVTNATDLAPLGQFEVRVTDPDANGAQVTAFPLRVGRQEQAGFTLEVRDDGDGQLGPGDGFTLANASWASAWEHDVEVWDLHAGAPLGQNAVPLPWGSALVAVLGAAALRRR